MKKHPPAGNWREFTKIKVNYTSLLKDWSYDDRNFRETFLIPFGMLKALERLYSNKKTYHLCPVLPESVKQELGLSGEVHKKEKMKLTVSHKGNKALKTFDYICCSICLKNKIPVVLEKYKDKLPEHAKVNNLIDQGDILGVADNLLDIAGCFIPDDKNVHAAPNGKRFILKPIEHSAFHSKP